MATPTGFEPAPPTLTGWCSTVELRGHEWHDDIVTNDLPGALDFNAYQQAAARTNMVIGTDHPIVYPTLGLTNEAGEVAGKVKKIFRDNHGHISDADREALALELGDVLWYLSEICTKLGIRLDDVAAGNIAKLADRASRGVLTGDGDHR